MRLDCSLLNKSIIGTKTWRSRSQQNGTSIQVLAHYWLKKKHLRLELEVPYKTEPHLPIKHFNIEWPVPLPPKAFAIYRIARRIRMMEIKNSAAITGQELGRIAIQCGEPLWLVNRLHPLMRHYADKPAQRKVKTDRVQNHSRYKTQRRKHLRGHGEVCYMDLNRYPELLGLMPAPPIKNHDKRDCMYICDKLIRLLRMTGKWEKVMDRDNASADDGTAADKEQAAHELLKAGLRVFLERTNSSEHVLRFYRTADRQAVRNYIALIKEIYPHDRILIKINRPYSISNDEALSAAKKDLKLGGITCKVENTTKTAYPKWPYGLPAISLLSESTTSENSVTPHISYGAWFGIYSFALLYEAICSEDASKQTERNDKFVLAEHVAAK